MNGPSPNEGLVPQPPFLWPEPRVWAGHMDYAHPVPYQSIIANGKTLLGVVSSIDHLGSEWLTTVVTENTALVVSLVIAVFAACPTRKRDLQDQCGVSEASDLMEEEQAA